MSTMPPDLLRENKDLTAHTYKRISEICMQSSALASDTGALIGIPVSACLLVILDILSAAEAATPDPSVIQAYRRELADRLLGKTSGSVAVGSDGPRPLE